MALSLAALLGGLALLTVASEIFVREAARTAVRLRMSPVAIGAVVIGFGTSLPEMLVSGLAAVEGSPDLAVGNVVGSNIANLTLVLGTAALVTPVMVRSTTVRREIPLSVFGVVLFAILVQGGLTVLEGIGLGLTLFLALWAIMRADPDPELVTEVTTEYDPTRSTARRDAIWLILGLIGTVAGAQLLIEGAIDLADRLGLAEGFVGLSVVAIGTSLPELATAVQAARRRETDLIVGNLLGSNLFNALAVGGITGVAGSQVLEDPSLTGFATILMVGVSVTAAAVMLLRRRVSAAWGLILLVAYAVSLPLLAWN